MSLGFSSCMAGGSAAVGCGNDPAKHVGDSVVGVPSSENGIVGYSSVLGSATWTDG